MGQSNHPLHSVSRFDTLVSAPRATESSSITSTFAIGGPRPLGGFDLSPPQPTLPSISISIRRLSSTAYSKGNCFAIGSMKPLTMSAIASSSLMPRLIR
jgi:hypothetical protein